MAKLCLSLTGKTLARDLEILEKNRKYVDLAELRVDCLDPDERFLIRRFPDLAGLPVILTIRRTIDGGCFLGGEGARITLLSKGLAFAEADRRRNFAYLDLEEDLNVPSLEEAARTFGTRIIRSYHNFHKVDDDLPALLRRLSRVGDEIAKVAVMPHSLEETLRVYQAARETAGIDKILLCMGHFGLSTRILAEKMGSFLSYCSVSGEPDFASAAPGHLSPQELSEGYRFREINAGTKVFAVTGYPLHISSSPVFFNTVFAHENINAVYIPIPADSFQTFLKLAVEIGLSGASVTVPYKEEVLSYIGNRDELESIGASNTIVRSPLGWLGYNTDARGFSGSLLAFLKKKNLRGKRITIIGAGGVAKAAASEVFRLKGRALILNRTPSRARDMALPYHFAWGALDDRGAQRMDFYRDIIIQTTSVGMEPDVEGDPMEFYQFRGREVVMDLIYKPERTRFLERAAEAGCPVLNGYDMLLRQARSQYSLFLGEEFPSRLVSMMQF